MKKILVLFALIVFILSGCSDKSNNIIEPQYTAQEELGRLSILDNLLNPIFSVTKLINGLLGGTINLTKNILGHDDVTGVSANLKIPKLAFLGLKRITMKAEIDKAAFVFSPHMKFNKSLELTATFYGVDFSKLPEWDGDIAFCYMAEDGTMIPCPNEGILYDSEKGILYIKKAKIDHFSRYGWVK